MNLLVVSFPCVTPINQQFFAKVENETGWNLTIVAPERWASEYGNVRTLERWPTFEGRLIALPVWLSGNIPLHIYRTTFQPLLAEINPDAIYVHNEPYAASTAQVYLANWLTNQRPIGFYSAQNIYKRYPPPFSFTEKFVYRQSRFSFPITKSVLQVMKRKGFDGSATILPLGIDSSLYSPDVRSSSLRESWKASNNDIVIGYLGRLVEEKGLDTLLDALARIPPSLSWQLVVVGSGPNERSFDDKARRFGLTPKIERVGYVSHDSAPKYLASFDILVVPSETQSSWKEQFGRVIIEALACGTPVIGSDSGEIPNLIKDTEGGLIFAERNPEALANCLRTLMHNPEKRRTLAERGRRVVHRDYTLSTLANQFATAIGQSVSA